MSGIENQVVLITGGSRGIGLACARRFAEKGARVAICGRDGDAARKAAGDTGGDAHGYACDVTDPAAVDEMIGKVTSEFGPVSVLVNNAGITRDGLILRMKDDQWREVLDTSLNGAFYLCRAAAKGMLRQRRGRIINISSIVGLHGQGGQANYAAAKAGLIGFTKALARELGSRNITVNAIAPGFIETDMTSGMDENTVSSLRAQIPLGRTGRPEDVAGVAAFLASEDAAWITGAVIPVDGGLGM